MKIKQVLIVTTASVGLLCMGFWYGNASAATNEPGSAGDPLVTKGYVDALLVFQVVNVPKNSQLVGEAGTEIVLRAGVGSAVVSPNGGLLDASDGVDLAQGVEVAKNHLLVVPRTDGRGVLAQTDAIFLVKGVYSIKPVVR